MRYFAFLFSLLYEGSEGKKIPPLSPRQLNNKTRFIQHNIILIVRTSSHKFTTYDYTPKLVHHVMSSTPNAIVHSRVQLHLYAHYN